MQHGMQECLYISGTSVKGRSGNTLDSTAEHKEYGMLKAWLLAASSAGTSFSSYTVFSTSYSERNPKFKPGAPA